MWNCENPNLNFSKNKICTLSSFWALRTIQLNLEAKMSKIHVRFQKSTSDFQNFDQNWIAPKIWSPNSFWAPRTSILKFATCRIKFCSIFGQFCSKSWHKSHNGVSYGKITEFWQISNRPISKNIGRMNLIFGFLESL